MTVVFQKEKIELIHKEMSDLLIEHYDELTKYKEKILLNPMWDRYIDLERNGKCVFFTVREGSLLVGYAGFFLDNHIHYADTRVAVNDVLFLKKEYRQGITGIKFIKYSEQGMRELGADKISWHVKFSNDFRPILHRMGYSDEEIIVTKMLS